MRRRTMIIIAASATTILSACGDVSAPRRDDASDCADLKAPSGYIMPSGYVCQ